jgi:hypothetical protein
MLVQRRYYNKGQTTSLMPTCNIYGHTFMLGHVLLEGVQRSNREDMQLQSVAITKLYSQTSVHFVVAY